MFSGPGPNEVLNCFCRNVSTVYPREVGVQGAIQRVVRPPSCRQMLFACWKSLTAARSCCRSARRSLPIIRKRMAVRREVSLERVAVQTSVSSCAGSRGLAGLTGYSSSHPAPFPGPYWWQGFQLDF